MSETFGPFCMNHKGYSGMSDGCPHCLEDKTKPVPPPTTEIRKAPDEVCTNCYLITGGLIGAVVTALVLLLSGCDSPKQPEQSCISKPPDGYYSVEDKGQICWKSKGWICVPKCPT